jgi:hypothetical protein
MEPPESGAERQLYLAVAHALSGGDELSPFGAAQIQASIAALRQNALRAIRPSFASHLLSVCAPLLEQAPQVDKDGAVIERRQTHAHDLAQAIRSAHEQARSAL